MRTRETSNSNHEEIYSYKIETLTFQILQDNEIVETQKGSYDKSHYLSGNITSGLPY